MILPGSTIGILGGGQLGRMLAMSAAYLGYRVHAFAPDADPIIAQVCNRYISADWYDVTALKAFADACDVVTLEFENVPAAPLQPIADKLAPHPRALAIAQDRLAEKRFVEELGGTPAPYHAVESRDALLEGIDRLGTPAILKTRRDGYDGKGQWRIGSREEAEALDFPGTPCVLEGFVTFECEFSVILARRADGAIAFWESAENDHADGILARSTLPGAAIIGEQVGEARRLAQAIADKLGYVGVLTCEFFAGKHGPIFNEMAPRVHNSGHWTIEGAATSQFENHIRAICGLPLGDTRRVAPRVVMENVIGPASATAYEALHDPAAHLHFYGKTDAPEGRKMGHITRLEWPEEGPA
ncbi:5-(carboxyamino)imidazole ribonucleotide synthase [Alteriqipengyuania sp.]|uniref:5-(carboxyamino)imidazole ribonucleotide synthase n=1 Tax=Alteriqipengyuania sp. TaxID=2800692 RepID=UPI003518ECE4